VNIVLTGHVPDAATRDRLAATANVNASAIELGRGAPEGFGAATDFSLAQLTHLSEGSFTITGARLSFSGRATTPADLKALENAVSSSVPAGFTVATSDVRPPLAEPFIWSATKAADGKITFSGYVPN
jgi:OOP family OmpA-OmpF porin